MVDTSQIEQYRIAELTIQLSLLERVPPAVVRRHGVLPVEVRQDRLHVLVSDPTDQVLADEIAFISGLHVRFGMLADGDLAEIIEASVVSHERGEAVYRPADGAPLGGGGMELVYVEDLADLGDLGALAAQAPPAEAAPVAAPPPPSPPLLTSPAAEPEAVQSGLPQVVDLEPDLVEEQAEAPSLRHAPGDDVVDPVLVDEDGLVDDEDLPSIHELSDLVGDEPGVATVQLSAVIGDPDPSERQRLVTELSPHGVALAQAATGDELLEQLRQDQPELILLDVALPGPHPFELCRQIRSEARHQKVALLLCSGEPCDWPLRADLQQLYGVDGLLPKPVERDVFLYCAERAVFRRAHRDLTLRDPQALALGVQCLEQGTSLYRQGDVDQAVVTFEEGLAADPMNPKLQASLGVALVKSGQPLRAMTVLERAVALDASLESALRSLAILYQKHGFRHKAFALWERTLHATQDDARRREAMGRLGKLLQQSRGSD